MKLNLSNRISLGYFFIIVVATVASLFCILSLRGNQNLDEEIQGIYQPVYLILKDLNALIDNSQKLSSNWVYQPSQSEKDKLKEIHTNDFPELVRKLRKIIDEKMQERDDNPLNPIIKESQDLLEEEFKLMSTLNADSLYSNDLAVDKAISLLDQSITPRATEIRKKLLTNIHGQESKMTEALKEKQGSYQLLTILLLSMILLFIAASLAAYLYSRKYIVQPIILLKNAILEIGQGKILNTQFEKRSDEIGEITNAISVLMEGMNAKSKFAIQIGQGNYQEKFQLISEDDIMGKALIEMRNNLQENAEEERKRIWATTGLAEIGLLLRQSNLSSQELFIQIVRFVVKYVRCNQGAMFILKEDESEEEYLHLVACYAYERRKFLETKIRIGQGVVGQCVLEKSTNYLTEIPKDYINITSGLGSAPPTSLLVVPLKVNEKVCGALELASFNKFERFEIDLIEKLAEQIASTIISVSINEKTRQLLEATQQQAAQMREQEEEMHQNVEELNATQEEMSRKEKEYQDRIQELEMILEQNNLKINDHPLT
jgi:methyl-accepting chemotaxis protein